MKKWMLGLSCLSGLAASNAWAIDLGPDVSLKGFGTLGVVSSNNSQADYLANTTTQPNGAGATRQITPTVDSKVGAQVDWKALPRLGLSAQVLSEQRYDGTYTPELVWAYAKYSPASSVDIRAGRLRAPIYMLSDYLDVNYANLWVRPPIEVYSTVPISVYEGADVIWRPSIGDVSLVVQPYYGYLPPTSQAAVQGAATTVAYTGFYGFNGSASWGDWTARVGYNAASVTLGSQPLAGVVGVFDGLCRAGDPGACDGRSHLGISGTSAAYKAMGFIYDNGEYVVSGEYAKREFNNWIVGDGNAWYLSGGWRTGKWTPYVTYAYVINEDPPSFNSGRIPLTNIVINGILHSSRAGQQTTTLGVRYDIDTSIALKAQVDHVQTLLLDGIPGTGRGDFSNTTTAFGAQANRVNVFSLSLDFVF